MLGDIGTVMKLLGSKDKIQAAMTKFQERLPDITAEGEAGGGLIRVTVNGRMEVLSCTLLRDVLTMNDPAAFGELIVAATNAALAQARAIVAAEAQAMAQGVGLPSEILKQFGGLLGQG